MEELQRHVWNIKSLLSSLKLIIFCIERKVTLQIGVFPSRGRTKINHENNNLVAYSLRPQVQNNKYLKQLKKNKNSSLQIVMYYTFKKKPLAQKKSYSRDYIIVKLYIYNIFYFNFFSVSTVVCLWCVWKSF